MVAQYAAGAAALYVPLLGVYAIFQSVQRLALGEKVSTKMEYADTEKNRYRYRLFDMIVDSAFISNVRAART
jgi:hypothetical protein